MKTKYILICTAAVLLLTAACPITGLGATVQTWRICHSLGDQQGSSCGGGLRDQGNKRDARENGQGSAQAGTGHNHESRATGRRRNELPTQVKREVEWKGEDGGSYRLVAGLEKTRSLPTDFMDLEVIGWPNKVTGANARPAASLSLIVRRRSVCGGRIRWT